jgi:predicted enzyme related to lactoylglutathione lyase
VAARIELVLDCHDADRLAEFWAAALGYERYGQAGNYRALTAPDGSGPKLILQQVSEAKRGKNRMHIDIVVPDIEAEATRLIELGATRVQPDPVAEHGTQWVLMADPEGNEFCCCRA